jgi:two-component system KDP operon response regulator KdpE
MMSARILLVDDEPSILATMAPLLRAQGYDVATAASGQSALEAADRQTPQLVILDLGLPDIDGIEVCRRLREGRSVPILVLSARGAEADKVAALDAGADDYVTKPFDVEELLARVRAVMRRVPRSSATPATVHVDGLEIDLARRQVRLDGEVVHLTRTELALLEQLVTHPGKLLTHEHLLRQVWGQGYGSESNYLRVYVGQLRRKLADDASSPRLILTEPGIGYRWIGSE